MVPSQNMQSYCNKTHFTYNLVWAIWVYSGKGNHAHVKEQVKLHFALGIGGLGISNLQNLNWALKMRWIWLQKTWLTTLVCIRNSSSWLCLGLIFHGRLAVVSEVGNVTSTLFWTDRCVMVGRTYVRRRRARDVRRALERATATRDEEAQGSGSVSG